MHPRHHRIGLALALVLALGCRREHDEPEPEPRPEQPADERTLVVRDADRGWECGELLIWRATEGGAFWAAPRDDPRPEQARELGFGDADSLACDGRHVYWLDTKAEAVQRRGLAPEDPIETIAAGDRYAYEIRTDGRRVYWLTSDADRWQVKSAPVEGGGETLVHRDHASLNPPLGLGEHHVYWQRVETRNSWTVFVLERSPLRGDPDTVEAFELPEAEHGSMNYTIVGGEIVYRSESTHQLFAVSEAEPGGPARLVHPHRDEFDRLRVRDGVAFYIGSNPDGAGFVAKALPLDSDAKPRAIGLMSGFQEEGFHVGERWLYWPRRGPFGADLHREAWR